MAKDYKKGDDYFVYLNTGTQVTPVWALVAEAINPSVDEAATIIKIEEAGKNTGSLKGYGDPILAFQLNRNKGNANVTAILTAAKAGTLKEFAIADGPIATTGTEYTRLEALIASFPLTANRGSGASYAITLHRHANSDFDLTYATAS